MRIDACFDSHVHWAATGEFTQRLDLSALASPDDVLNIRPETMHFHGEWLTGFGWDETKWNEKPDKKILDKLYPTTPVALSRCDAHALWVNSEALKRAGIQRGNIPQLKGGRIELDKSGEPTGLLVDRASDLVFNLIPAANAFETRRYMLQAIKVFNDAGYTHIRDMTCDEMQWNEAVRLDQSGLLTLAVEEYFRLKGPAELDKVLLTVQKAKAAQTANLRVMGIKLFLDGALGSEGALLSRCYCGREHAGLKLWDEDSLRETMLKTWAMGLEVAVHAIGDAAADIIVRVARELHTQGHNGKLHIEHGELIRQDTVDLMKGLAVEVHIQPSHWLSDQRWLKNKVGDLIQHAFPWRRLQEAEIPFDFGSDAPIEQASVSKVFEALRHSAEAGIPRLLGSPTNYMTHKDLAWAPNSFTVLEEEKPVQVVFRGEHLN
jgi:predicted amidohydrolase YtcJ